MTDIDGAVDITSEAEVTAEGQLYERGHIAYNGPGGLVGADISLMPRHGCCCPGE